MRILTFVLVLLLCGCGDGGRQATESAPIFDTQRQGLEKAKQVTDTLQGADQRSRAAEEDQTK